MTLNCCHGESLAGKGKPLHVWQPERSEVFCVGNKGHLQQKDSQEEKLIFFFITITHNQFQACYRN